MCLGNRPLILCGCFVLAATPALAHRLEPAMRQVYDRICSVAGVSRAAPNLVIDMSSSAARGAWVDFTGERTTITVEARALDVCASFGEKTSNALAFLLGHEVAHYAMAHNWGRQFRMANEDGRVRSDLLNVELALNTNHFYEMQADQRGAFYAERAGYPLAGLVDSLIDRLYGAYGWKAALSNYPDLPERRALLNKGLEGCRDMMMVLRLANLRLLMGHVEEALALYEILLEEGHAEPGTLTNAALCCFLLAQPMAGGMASKFRYPLAVDLREGWRSGSSRSFEALTTRCERLLSEALLADPDSPLILADMACLFLMRGELREADHWIWKRSRVMGGTDRTRSILEALSAELGGDRNKAITLLSAGDLKEDPTAMGNLALLKGVPLPAQDAAPALEEIRVNGLGFEELTRWTKDSPKRIVDHRGRTMLQYQETEGIWRIRAGRSEEGTTAKVLYLVGIVARTTTGEQTLRVDDARKQVEARFGAPQRSLVDHLGEVVFYPAVDEAGLLVHYDASDRVRAFEMYQEITSSP